MYLCRCSLFFTMSMAVKMKMDTKAFKDIIRCLSYPVTSSMINCVVLTLEPNIAKYQSDYQILTSEIV